MGRHFNSRTSRPASVQLPRHSNGARPGTLHRLPSAVSRRRGAMPPRRMAEPGIPSVLPPPCPNSCRLLLAVNSTTNISMQLCVQDRSHAAHLQCDCSAHVLQDLWKRCIILTMPAADAHRAVTGARAEHAPAGMSMLHSFHLAASASASEFCSSLLVHFLRSTGDVHMTIRRSYCCACFNIHRFQQTRQPLSTVQHGFFPGHVARKLGGCVESLACSTSHRAAVLNNAKITTLPCHTHADDHTAYSVTPLTDDNIAAMLTFLP